MNSFSKNASTWLKGYILGLFIFLSLYLLSQVLLGMVFKVFIYNEDLHGIKAYEQTTLYYRYVIIGYFSSILLLIILPFLRKKKAVWILSSLSIIPISLSYPIKVTSGFLRQYLMINNSKSINLIFMIIVIVFIVLIVIFFFKKSYSIANANSESVNLLDSKL